MRKAAADRCFRVLCSRHGMKYARCNYELDTCPDCDWERGPGISRGKLIIKEVSREEYNQWMSQFMESIGANKR